MIRSLPVVLGDLEISSALDFTEDAYAVYAFNYQTHRYGQYWDRCRPEDTEYGDLCTCLVYSSTVKNIENIANTLLEKVFE